MPPSLENSESHDGESQERICSITGTIPSLAPKTSSGYYDAEKCRAHIANQIKVSKIDRFAAQVSKAIEIEVSVQSRLSNIFGMFVKRSAQVTHDFTFKCKLGLQRHRQDRILNQRRKSSLKNKIDTRHSDNNNKQYSISNDLLYGYGAQLVHALLSQSLPQPIQQHQTSITDKRNDNPSSTSYLERGGTLSEDDYILSDLFEPTLFVSKLKDCIRNNMQKSRAITAELSSIRQIFERLTSEHRDQVDMVYTQEEERQTKSVIRRSAYSLSNNYKAAIKATTNSTPIHLNSNTNEIS